MKKQYTIRGIDEELDHAIRETAAQYEVSVNKAAVALLRKGAGLDAPPAQGGPPYHDLDDLAGALSPGEAGQLLKNAMELRRIDPELWNRR